MPRGLLSRLLAHTALILAVLLVAGGLLVDRFLVQREIGVLSDHLAGFARVAALDLPAAGAGLQEDLGRRGGAEGIRLTVIAPDGVVLGDTHQDPAVMENHANRPEVAEALRGRRGQAVRRSPTLGVKMLYVALPAAAPGAPVVRAALPLADVTSLLRGIRLRLALAAVPAVLLAFGLALVLARGLTRRLAATARFTGRLADGDYDATLPVRGVDELADLERNLVALRDELRAQVGTLVRDRERLSALIDGLPDAVVVLDGAARLVLANGPARALLRLSREEVVGQPGAEILREPRLVAALDQAYGGDREPPGEPFRIPWSDPPHELEVTLRALPDEAGRPGVLLILHDVTRRVQLERVRRDFIANLSHELRTPLTAIRGAAETLLDAALADPEATRRFLETIRRHSLRLETLLRDVAALARIEAGAAAPRPEPFDAREVLRQVADLFAAEAEKAGVHLEVRVPEEPVALTSDPSHLETILVNLVQNAVRYTPRGGRVTVTAEPDPAEAVFRVEDTGVGIPPRDLPRVTERFYRVDPSRSRAEGGTGLGLSIVKHLVDGLGGDLQIHSEYGVGTRVAVTVPSRLGIGGADT